MTAPAKFAHLALHTSDVETAKEWYLKVLDARVMFQNELLCFMSYDDEHHRVVLVNNPSYVAPETHIGFKTPVINSALHHFTFTFASLDDLLNQYNTLKEHGIVPTMCLNHGPTLSMYYQDPMNNAVELQIDTMLMEQAFEFMNSELFLKNPIGQVFNPDELSEQRKAGATFNDIVAWR